MYCTNCGKQIEDGSRFCTGCGTPVAQQNTNSEAPTQQPVSPAQTETPVQSSSTQQPAEQPTEQPAQQPQAAPVNEVPEQSAPVNNIPPFNQAGNSTAAPQPTQGQQTDSSPAGNPLQPIAEKAKKINPIIFVIAGVVVAVAIIVIIIVMMICNSGVKGVLNNMEKAINDQDVDALYDCYPSFVAEDMDIDEDTIDSAFGMIEGVKISCTLEDEEDITDEDYEYDDSITWQEYIQEQYEDYDEYDGEEVEKVVEAEYTMEYSFDNYVADYIADALTDEDETEQTGVFVKVDGDWYIYEN